MDSSDLDDFDTDEGEIDDEEDPILQDPEDCRSSNSNCGDDGNNSDDLRGLVGLQNLGNTCYINAALQALSNCQQLTRFVLDRPGCIKSNGLSRCYSELINEIWNSKNAQYAVPTSIIRNIKCIYPAFRGCTQQDTQEFLRCFLEQLHDELKQPAQKKHSTQNQRKHHRELNSDSSNVMHSSTSSLAPSITSSNDEAGDNGAETFEEAGGPESCSSLDNNPKNNISSDSLQQQRSIISDTFEFRISSSIVCSSCNNISTTKETFKDLSVPIPSRDHPYYTQSSDYNDSSHLIQLEESDQKASMSSSSSTSESISRSTSRRVECTNEFPPNSSSTTKFKTDCGQTSDQGDNEGLELQAMSYLDSIPLARWFLNWFSQLGSWFWGPQVTLYDCLSVFFGTDPLEGDNEYSCEVCTKKNRGVKFLKIIELPEVLCIHFKRYESVGSAKITTHVSFPLEGLDLAPFMSPDNRAQCTTYNLIACICHHGSALLTGHYTTYALNCYDDQWYEFDDQYVTCVSSYQVENSEAYILFYQKSTPERVMDVTGSRRANSLALGSLRVPDEFRRVDSSPAGAQN